MLPLVSEYVSTIASNAEVHRDLVSKFCLLDAEGRKMAVEEYEVCWRRFWLVA